MKVIPLVVEGIENKIKRLIFHNRQLKEENHKHIQERERLETHIRQLTDKTNQLEDQLDKLKITKTLSGKDQLQARQQIDELLREIHKCYALLNR